MLTVCVSAFAGVADKDFLYREDFDKGIPKNWAVKDKLCKWTVKGGVFSQVATTPKYAPIYHMGHHTWTDFEVRLRLKIKKLGVHKGTSYVFNIAVWGVTANLIPGTSALTWVPAGKKKGTAVSAYDKSVKIDPNKWYDIRIEYHPQKVTLYFEGKKMVECTEPPPRGAHQSILMRFLNVNTELDYFHVIEKKPLGKQGGAQ